MTSCGCLLLEKVEDNGGEAAARGSGKIAPAVGCGYCTGKWKSRSEAIFPIYVMGSSRPSTVAAARSIVDSVGDPIWDAVKAEAKSEVSVLPNLARAARLEHHLRRLRLRPPLPRALSSSLATAAPPHARFSAPASSAPLHERSAAETMETTTKAMEAVAAAAAAAEKDERLRLEFAYLALLAQKAHRFEGPCATYLCNDADEEGMGLKWPKSTARRSRLPSDDENRDTTGYSSRSSEELWQAFFANPLDWWDNMANKITHMPGAWPQKPASVTFPLFDV